MTDKHPMTVQSFEQSKAALHQMKTIDRPAIAKKIGIARDHGDLSENAEYHAEKDAQGMLEAKIRSLEAKLAGAQVIDVEQLSGDKVVFGATVDLSDVDTGEERTVCIVGEEQANADKGLISYLSPLSRSLIGKQVDDIAIVKLPAGNKEYEIMDIRFVVPDCE